MAFEIFIKDFLLEIKSAFANYYEIKESLKIHYSIKILNFSFSLYK